MLDVPLADRVLALGLVADRVIEVVSIAPEQIEIAPDIGVPWRSDYIQGVVRRETSAGKAGFVVLFDLARLLTAHDAAALSQAA